jgi:hypothetical protein
MQELYTGETTRLNLRGTRCILCSQRITMPDIHRHRPYDKGYRHLVIQTCEDTRSSALLGVRGSYVPHVLPSVLSTASAQARHEITSYCSARAGWRGARLAPRPGLSASPSRPVARNRCTHL